MLSTSAFKFNLRRYSLVMLSVEGVAGTFRSWYKEVDVVRAAMVDHIQVGARGTACQILLATS